MWYCLASFHFCSTFLWAFMHVQPVFVKHVRTSSFLLCTHAHTHKPHAEIWTNIHQHTHANIRILPSKCPCKEMERKTYWYPNTSSWPNSSASSHCPISILLSNARSRTFTCSRSNGWNKPCCFFKQTLHTSRSEEMLRWSVTDQAFHKQL